MSSSRQAGASQLVAIDMPGGPRFVDALSRIWDDGDAAFVVDRRHPAPLAGAVLATAAPSAVVEHDGERRSLGGGRPVEPGDALVVATSGTAGAPRGVVLTHAAVAVSARITSARLAVAADDSWLACLPLAHIGGLSVVTRALVTGTALTVVDGFDPAVVAASPATLVSLVAATLGRIDPAAFRVIVLGGSAPPATRPDNVVTTYGMTETGSGVVYDGRPLDGVGIRIAPDGEIAVSGPTLLRAYRDGTDPVVDGWFATGDLGELDDSGRLVVHGRRGDLIVTGGENVWPEPVEAALRGHPDVLDVAVAGVPDRQWGAAVTAFVVAADPPPPLAALRDHVKQTLAAYAAPKRLHIVERVPRTTLGKIRRDALVALATSDVASDTDGEGSARDAR